MSMHKVVVYGSLRKGLHNHNSYLKDAKLIGEYDTEPIYNLYSLGTFPGLKENGTTSIKMEVYEVNYATLSKIDLLEGIDIVKPMRGFYTKKEIETPYGDAFGYVYNGTVNKNDIVLDGNWAEHIKFKKSMSCSI